MVNFSRVSTTCQTLYFPRKNLDTCFREHPDGTWSLWYRQGTRASGRLRNLPKALPSDIAYVSSDSRAHAHHTICANQVLSPVTSWVMYIPCEVCTTSIQKVASFSPPCCSGQHSPRPWGRGSQWGGGKHGLSLKCYFTSAWHAQGDC